MGRVGGGRSGLLGPRYLGNISLNFPVNSLLLSAPALPADVNVALRKIANLLKPDKEIVQNGDHMIIRTLSTFRNYIMDFQVGEEFEEDLTGIDDRKCMVRLCVHLGICCPGVLTEGRASSSERGARAFVFLGAQDLHTPSPQGRQLSTHQAYPLKRKLWFVESLLCPGIGALYTCLHLILITTSEGGLSMPILQMKKQSQRDEATCSE